MLDALRRSVGSWFVKPFIGLIMLSFAVWGVSDVFTGSTGDEVARVGDTEIPAQAFRSTYQRELQQISQQFGTYLSPDQARSMGLDRQILSRMIGEAALDDEAERRGMGMSDAAVARSIRNDPTFTAPGGQFDRSYFNQYLSATGNTEARYVEEQRRRLLRNVIGETVSGRPNTPEVLATAIDRYQKEERSAEFVHLTEDALEEIPSPSEEELEAFFEERQGEFRAPEYRQVALIALTPEDAAERVEVSEEDARAYFEARADQFQVPEQRTIEQITFESPEDAAAAREAIADGASFEDIAAEQGVSESDRVLGTMTRDDVVDDAVADAAFDLAEGEVSAPIDGMFAPSLVRVTEIQEGEQPEFAEVAGEIRQQLATERASSLILDLYDDIEDDRAAGLTFAEIAEHRDVPYREIEALDEQGRNADGEAVELPESPELLPEIFRTEAGVEADPVQLAGDGYAWFDVLDVTPARDRTFEEAREDVEAAWRQERVREELQALAEEALEAVEGGASFEDVAAEYDTGAETGTVDGLRREGTTDVFGNAAVSQLFVTPEDEVRVAETAQSPGRVVFRTTEVSVPDYEPSEDDPVAERIANNLSDDLMNQYVTHLQDELGVSINQQALRQALGQTDGQF